MKNRDKVVYEKGISYLMEVRIHPKTNNVTVRRIFDGNNFARHVRPLSKIRHATPEEISASHRIDNELGDDSHIENHISPNCQSRDV